MQARKTEKLMKISFTEIYNSYQLILAEELSLSPFVFGKSKNQTVFRDALKDEY